ncbi:hypothetical protein OGR47_08790 [Methylocystis sp. MJC1]|jgi:hypothetical protein|uniref:hypothetical protein n=1 Tax=Methylocystis sp. MJC1 TaxID=2654282 RepID=UPI0013EBE337|nr:hypothetical protein [Methylocystis sp. MJC1]KAF2991680.1 hypothetical protein MJC1_01245 [Methylocystis sp. MJC1]MBU6527082.1 hypothetical protein [Methylocystis sp. MJC1]UZX13518.1 hypothetical protein OGR47_08790 [Methylocystis sp. MJC1]
MPRFSVSIGGSVPRSLQTVKADQYGRRIRHVEGVHVVGENLLLPLFFKVALALALLAAATSSIAAWRLFAFPH